MFPAKLRSMSQYVPSVFGKKMFKIIVPRTPLRQQEKLSLLCTRSTLSEAEGGSNWGLAGSSRMVTPSCLRMGTLKSRDQYY